MLEDLHASFVSEMAKKGAPPLLSQSTMTFHAEDETDEQRVQRQMQQLTHCFHCVKCRRVLFTNVQIVPHEPYASTFEEAAAFRNQLRIRRRDAQIEAAERAREERQQQQAEEDGEEYEDDDDEEWEDEEDDAEYLSEDEPISSASNAKQREQPEIVRRQARAEQACGSFFTLPIKSMMSADEGMCIMAFQKSLTVLFGGQTRVICAVQSARIALERSDGAAVSAVAVSGSRQRSSFRNQRWTCDR